VWHRIEGRARIRVPERRGDAAYFSAVREALFDCEAVERCEVNPATASVLIEHEGPFEVVAGHAEQAQLFRLAQLTPAIVPGRVHAQHNLRRLDDELTRASGGEVDLATLIFAALLVMAGVQLLRGQVLAPAATLVWYALATLRFLAPPEEGGSSPATPGTAAGP
jgi:hypothetical protein